MNRCKRRQNKEYQGVKEFHFVARIACRPMSPSIFPSVPVLHCPCSHNVPCPIISHNMIDLSCVPYAQLCPLICPQHLPHTSPMDLHIASHILYVHPMTSMSSMLPVSPYVALCLLCLLSPLMFHVPPIIPMLPPRSPIFSLMSNVSLCVLLYSLLCPHVHLHPPSR